MVVQVVRRGMTGSYTRLPWTDVNLSSVKHILNRRTPDYFTYKMLKCLCVTAVCVQLFQNGERCLFKFGCS